MPIHHSFKQHFDASSLTAKTLLKKKISTLIVYEKLIDCGMPVTGMCIPIMAHAIQGGLQHFVIGGARIASTWTHAPCVHPTCLKMYKEITKMNQVSLVL